MNERPILLRNGDFGISQVVNKKETDRTECQGMVRWNAVLMAIKVFWAIRSRVWHLPSLT
jgi:hypothetical protein